MESVLGFLQYGQFNIVILPPHITEYLSSYLCLFQLFHQCLIIFNVNIFTSLDKFIPRHFILYDTSVNGIVFLIPPCNGLLLVNQNNQFFILILHLSTLLNFLISSNSVLMESLVFSLYNIRSSAKRDFCTFPFLIWCLYLFLLLNSSG